MFKTILAAALALTCTLAMAAKPAPKMVSAPICSWEELSQGKLSRILVCDLELDRSVCMRELDDGDGFRSWAEVKFKGPTFWANVLILSDNSDPSSAVATFAAEWNLKPGSARVVRSGLVIDEPEALGHDKPNCWQAASPNLIPHGVVDVVNLY